MLCAALAFSSMGALAHGLGDRCDWQMIAIARTGLALVFAAGLAWAAGARLVFWGPRSLWLRSIAGSISLVCTFFALTRLPVADVLTLTNVFPIWVALLSWPLLKERPGRGTWLAVACGLLGVVLIQQPHIAQRNFAALLALISSFTSALAMMGLHRLQRVDVRAIVVHFSAVSLTICVVAWLAQGTHRSTERFAEASTWWMLLGVGVSATIGQLFLTKAFAFGPPAKVSVVGLTQVGFGLVFDVLIWDRSFSSLSLVGMLLVTAPTAWLLTHWED